MYLFSQSLGLLFYLLASTAASVRKSWRFRKGISNQLYIFLELVLMRFFTLICLLWLSMSVSQSVSQSFELHKQLVGSANRLLSAWPRVATPQTSETLYSHIFSSWIRNINARLHEYIAQSFSELLQRSVTALTCFLISDTSAGDLRPSKATCRPRSTGWLRMR